MRPLRPSHAADAKPRRNEATGIFINCRIPCHLKLYPLKSGYLATQLVHALALFYVFYFSRFLGYVVTWLHRLKNELDSCVAFLFWLMDYCFGTLIKERVKFLFSALFSTWKNKDNVQKPRPRSYQASS